MDKDKDLTSWLKYLEQAHNQEIDLSLVRIKQVCSHLNLYPSMPVITVAGTNGKGSTCNFLSYILSAAHYKVGLYTSPHLINFNERIKINNQDVDDATLIQAFEVIEQAKINCNVSLSYFEFTTLAAMYIFIQNNVDSIVLEVGLGGRLDAVNIFNPICSIITSIGIDHTQYLGNTREEIALEKAGIFRSQIPAVCGDENPPLTLINHAQQHNVPLYCIKQDFNYIHDGNLIETTQWSWVFNGKNNTDTKSYHSLCFPSLRGMNQLRNASCALMALHLLHDILPVSTQDIRRGLSNIELIGRFTILTGQPTVVFDVAHNAHASAILVDNLDRMGFYSKNIAIFGAMQDKDISSMLLPLKDIVDEWHICELPTTRSASLTQIKQALQQININVPIKFYTSVENAYANIEKQISKEERLIIFGSFYTVAQAIHYKNNLNEKYNKNKHPQRSIKSFIQRKGRTTNAQKNAIDNLGQIWLIDYDTQVLDYQKIFKNNNPVILEIGFGMGDTTAQIAQNNPNLNFIAIEVYEAGVGALLQHINNLQLKNIRIIQHDAIEVMQNMLEKQSLSGIHIFFPDPWHKTKHNKRRIIQPNFLDLLTYKLKPQAYVHCATDWQDYANHILHCFTQHKNFILDTNKSEHNLRPQTKFERRGIRLGHTISDLCFTYVAK